MPSQTAINYFLGKQGFRRLSCAQSIAQAFQKELGVVEDVFEKLQDCGGGKAPEGFCGAFYGALVLLQHYAPNRTEEFERYFLEQAGSLQCKEIRRLRKLSCTDCIRKSCEFISLNIKADEK